MSLHLLDTGRALGLLQGLRACHLVRGLPLSSEEKDMSEWLEADLLIGGMEAHVLDRVESNTDSKRLQRQMSHQQQSRRFVYTIASSNYASDARVATFLHIVNVFCQRNCLLMPIAFNSDHPVELAGRVLIATLLKHCDLVSTALELVEAGSVKLTPDNDVRMPPPIIELCRIVHQAKLKLIQDHQGSSRSYTAICTPMMERCFFLLYEIGPAMTNAMSVLNRRRIVKTPSKWKTAIQMVIDEIKFKSSLHRHQLQSTKVNLAVPRNYQRQLSSGDSNMVMSLHLLFMTRIKH